jgi:hypothetical protein
VTTDLLPIRRLQAHYRADAVRLARVNDALSTREEYACAQAMPTDIRPQVARPTLSRAALQEFAWMLGQRLRELDTAIREALAERRN